MLSQASLNQPSKFLTLEEALDRQEGMSVDGGPQPDGKPYPSLGSRGVWRDCVCFVLFYFNIESNKKDLQDFADAYFDGKPYGCGGGARA